MEPGIQKVRAVGQADFSLDVFGISTNGIMSNNGEIVQRAGQQEWNGKKMTLEHMMWDSKFFAALEMDIV